MNTTNKNQLM
jgi:hypothetical protein